MAAMSINPHLPGEMLVFAYRRRHIQLPPGVWLQICGNLDYETLKKLPLVCQNFNNILSPTLENENGNSWLDKALFRDYPIDEKDKAKEGANGGKDNNKEKNKENNKENNDEQDYYSEKIENNDNTKPYELHPYLKRQLKTHFHRGFFPESDAPILRMQDFFNEPAAHLASVLSNFVENMYECKLFSENATSPASRSFTVVSHRRFVHLEPFTWYLNRENTEDELVGPPRNKVTMKAIRLAVPLEDPSYIGPSVLIIESEDMGVSVGEVILGRLVARWRLHTLPGEVATMKENTPEEVIRAAWGLLRWRDILPSKEKRDCFEAWVRESPFIGKLLRGRDATYLVEER